MERPSDVLSVAAVLLSQSLPRHLSMLPSIFWPLPLDHLNGVIGGARCGKKLNTPEVLVRDLSFALSDGIKRRGVGATQSG